MGQSRDRVIFAFIAQNLVAWDWTPCKVRRVEIHTVRMSGLQFLFYLNLGEGLNDVANLKVVEVDE